MSIVSSHNEFKDRVLELLNVKGVKRVDFLERLADKMCLEAKSAENYLYGRRYEMLKFEKITDIAFAIDESTFLDNFFYILNLEEQKKKITRENCAQRAEKSLNSVVPDNVTINGVCFVRADGAGNSSITLDKWNTSSAPHSPIPKNATMQFVCNKETSLVTPYPIQGGEYKYEYLRHYGRERSQDNYIVVGGNIYHADSSHPFGYRLEHNQNTISLYSLIVGASEQGVPPKMIAEYIENFQRVHKRQKFLYGTIGKGGISTNAFCWLNFIAGFYSNVYEEKFSS